MIIYFSATGNSKFVAEKIADEFNQKTASILEIDDVKLNDGEILGFVFPTYFWGLPSVVSEKLDALNIGFSEDNYTFFVATYGTTTGQISRYVSDKVHIDAKFSVKMPDTWTPTYDLSNKDEVAKINANEIPQINEIILHIKNRDSGDFINSKTPFFAAKIAQKFYEKQRQTSNLVLENSCIGCGICQKNCPIAAIEIKDKTPVWIKDKCVMCLSCLHHCPKFAIQYKNRTNNHGQYEHP